MNVLFGGRGSHMGSAIVPLDRAMLSSYRLSIVTIPLSVTVWPQFAMQILIGGSDPLISPSHGGPELYLTLFGTTRVSLPNGISFRPLALAGCSSVSDDRRTEIWTTHDNVCRSR